MDVSGITLTMGDDMLDDDIIEIFIEEAEEVFETINEHFPTWSNDYENLAALQEVRRAFHTLKGSGRMVKAKVIADVAWALEHMINRVIDGAIGSNSNMVIVVERALDVLPPLIEQFKRREKSEVTLEIEQLIEQTTALARGEDVELSQGLPVLGEGGVAVGGHSSMSGSNMAGSNTGAGHNVDASFEFERLEQLDIRVEELNSRVFSIDKQLSEQDNMRFSLDDINAKMGQLDNLNKTFVHQKDLDELCELIDSVSKDNQEMRYFLNANNTRITETLDSFSAKNKASMHKQVQAAEQQMQTMQNDFHKLHQKLFTSQVVAVAAILIAASALVLPML